MHNFKIYVFLKKHLKNGVFDDLETKTCAKPPVFSPFSSISGGLEGLFDFYDPLHHHPQTGHSPRR
jgi:hypothetical protein